MFDHTRPLTATDTTRVLVLSVLVCTRQVISTPQGEKIYRAFLLTKKVDQHVKYEVCHSLALGVNIMF